MNAAEQKLEPLRMSVTVPLSQQQAFALFTERIDTWWPLEVHAVSRDRGKTCSFEPRAGGRIKERTKSGEEYVWANVLAYEPPRRIVVSWHPNNSPATELEITFTPADPGTLVELEHRNWEVFGELAEEARTAYSGGWTVVIAERFVAAAEKAPWALEAPGPKAWGLKTPCNTPVSTLHWPTMMREDMSTGMTAQPVPLPSPFLGETVALRTVNGVTLSENIYARGSRVARHTHESSFFSLTLRGGYVETHRNADLEYGAGSVSFHPPCDEHSLRIGEGAARCLNIELDAAWQGHLKEISNGAEIVRTENGPLLWLTARLHAAFRSPFAAGEIIQNLVLEMLGSVALRDDEPRDAREPLWLASVDEMIRAEALQLARRGEVALPHGQVAQARG